MSEDEFQIYNRGTTVISPYLRLNLLIRSYSAQAKYIYHGTHYSIYHDDYFTRLSRLRKNIEL